jgi:hypothetical protein
MREVLKRLGDDYTGFKYRLLVGRQYPQGIFVLGVYPQGETYGGTDRLSMAVQPHAVRFLSKVPAKSVVIFEGDRLTRSGFLGTAKNVTVILLETSAEERARRHAARADSQSSAFLRSRQTLITGIAQTFPVTRLLNERQADVERNADRILTLISNSI